MKNTILTVTISLAMAAAAHADEAVVPYDVPDPVPCLVTNEMVTMQETPVALSQSQVAEQISDMTYTIANMTFVPRDDAVSVTARNYAAGWNTTIDQFATEWSARAAMAIAGLAQETDEAFSNFPESIGDFQQSSLHADPVSLIALNPPESGFFGQ